jgi:hypothetical protein
VSLIGRTPPANVVVGLFVLVVLLVGCNSEPPPEALIGDGSNGGATWAAWVKRSGDGGLCLEVRVLGRKAESLCAIDADGTSIWRPDIGADRLLLATSSEVGASSAVVRLADGTELPVDVVHAPDVTTTAIFVVPLQARVDALELIIRATDGTVLEIVSLDDR